MGMFDFFGMADTYESRKVDRYDADGLMISTCLVTDASKPYETAVQYDKYGPSMTIVATYDTREEAQAGHDEWVARMTGDDLPAKLIDVGLSEVKQCGSALIGSDDWADHELVED